MSRWACPPKARPVGPVFRGNHARDSDPIADPRRTALFGLFRRAKRTLGAAGEDAAAAFLRKSGVRILARNYRCAAGEIDLIGAESGTIVFVEVKTRRADQNASPENNITPAKQNQLARVARYWLAQHHYPDNAYRFDAVSVVLPEVGPPQVRRIIEAFVPRRG